MGLGLHPFYALVTDTTGNHYQTQTDWIRLIPSFKLSISGPPLTLSWPAIPGQGYDVLATTNLSSPFQTVTSLVASNTVIQWPIPAPSRDGQLLPRELESVTPSRPPMGRPAAEVIMLSVPGRRRLPDEVRKWLERLARPQGTVVQSRDCDGA